MEARYIAGLAAVLAFGTRCGGSRQADAGVDASSEARFDTPTEGGVDGSAEAGDGSGDSGDCNPPCGYVNFATLTCCGGKCVELANDPYNCGGCGTVCSGATPYCLGSCMPPPCLRDAASCGTGTCCGSSCCSSGQLCCNVEQGGSVDVCYTPKSSQDTCEQGCKGCL